MLVVQVDTVASYGSRASEATKNRRDRTARHGPLHDKYYELKSRIADTVGLTA